MNWRAAPLLLVSLSLLSLIGSSQATAQDRNRNGFGFHAQAPHWGGGGRFGGPAAGGPAPNGSGASGRGPAGYGRPDFGGRGYGPPPARAEYGRSGYGAPRNYSQNPYARSDGGYGLGGRAGYPPPAYGRPYGPGFGGGFEGAPPPSFGGDWRSQQNEVRQAVREGRHIPLGQAIESVRRRTPGRELDADLIPGAGGRAVYRLRWASSNGRRIDYLVDAATGAIVGAEGAP